LTDSLSLGLLAVGLPPDIPVYLLVCSVPAVVPAPDIPPGIQNVDILVVGIQTVGYVDFSPPDILAYLFECDDPTPDIQVCFPDCGSSGCWIPDLRYPCG